MCLGLGRVIFGLMLDRLAGPCMAIGLLWCGCVAVVRSRGPGGGKLVCLEGGEGGGDLECLIPSNGISINL